MICFMLRGLPKTPNQLLRQHYRIVKAEKDRWHQAVNLITRTQRPIAPLQKARVTLIRYSSHKLDFEGLVGSFKYILDGLVEAGVLHDDDTDTIGQPEYLWQKVPQKVGRIEVKIEEVV